MAQTKVLYTSAQVRNAVTDIFRHCKGRRVAITAFVGSGAEAFLPRPKGIELTCWPSPSGTNPQALRELRRLGVKVFFSDRLHTKLYWTEDKGAVITSANLSTNAFGAGNLQEFGIWVQSGLVDIDRVISGTRRRRMTRNELYELDKAYQLYHARNATVATKTVGRSFLDWYQDEYRERWKLKLWEALERFSANALQIARQEGVPEPFASVTCTKTAYSAGDWALCIRLRQRGIGAIEWMPVDFVTRTNRSDDDHDPGLPYEAVQLRAMKYYRPPFHIDNRFRKALSKAITRLGNSQLEAMDLTRPSKHLLDLIRKNY